MADRHLYKRFPRASAVKKYIIVWGSESVSSQKVGFLNVNKSSEKKWPRDEVVKDLFTLRFGMHYGVRVAVEKSRSPLSFQFCC